MRHPTLSTFFLRRTCFAFVMLSLLPLLCSAQVKIAASQELSASPFSLTTQDGTGLELVSLEAKAVIDGPLAFTELHLTFHNPQSRTIEGRFEITMPDRAAISRFAMKINGIWMEGEVVEKQAARRAYEDALHRRQDPALLEQDAGNQFRARVFPITANENKELIISWSQELSNATERYTLPLKGLPEIQRLALTGMIARAGKASGVTSSLGGENSRFEVTQVRQQKFKPTEDWILSGEAQREDITLRSNNVALMRVTLPEATLSRPKEDHMMILLDTSASAMMDFEKRTQRLKTLCAGLPEIGIKKISVIAFDQTHQLIFEGAPEELSEGELDTLRSREALGASSLEVGIQGLQALLTKAEPSDRRLLIISDGVYTDGASKPGELQLLLSANLPELHIKRVDVLVDQTARDLIALEAITTVNGLSSGKVLTLSMSKEEHIERLGQGTFGSVNVQVSGAKWTWPSTLSGKQPGDQVLIFADVQEGQTLKLTLSGSALSQPLYFEPKSQRADDALLHRAWIRARIERMEGMIESADPDLQGVWREQVIKLSTQHRVVSSYTALVVLENEGEYARFGIDRRALSDILVVGASGVEVIARTIPLEPTTTTIPPSEDGAKRGKAKADQSETKVIATEEIPSIAPQERDADEIIEGIGGLGLVGIGTGGGGIAVSSGADPSQVIEHLAEASAVPTTMRHEEELEFEDSATEVSSLASPEPSSSGVQVDSLSLSGSSAADPIEEPAAAISMQLRSGGFGGGDSDAREPRRDTARVARRPASRVARRPASNPLSASRSRSSRSEISQSSRRRVATDRSRRQRKSITPALTGEMASIFALVDQGDAKKALESAMEWRAKEPTNLLTLIALGRALELSGDSEKAARAYGSIIDFYPSRADMRRLAGNWLERLGEGALRLTISTYQIAAQQRPDHPSVYHMLGMALVKAQRYDEALKVFLEGKDAKRADRFIGVDQILLENAQLVAAAIIQKHPKRESELKALLEPKGLKIDQTPSVRFILSWETDANDVDFHIYDARKNHAFYSSPKLSSGGSLYADITTGYGPECFKIDNPKASPYTLKAHYYSRGPMGYGSGKLQVLLHDGQGNLSFDDRPFVIMNDGAFVELGTVKLKGKRSKVKLAK